MTDFPRTTVGGISVSRLIAGTNWFLGFSHTSAAKDRFITSYQSRERIVEILKVFMEYGVDTVMAPPAPILSEAVQDLQQQTGRAVKLILTPHFNILPGGPKENEPERVIAACQEQGATFCFPHQVVTDALLDRMHGVIRDIDR